MSFNGAWLCICLTLICRIMFDLVFILILADVGVKKKKTANRVQQFGRKSHFYLWTVFHIFVCTISRCRNSRGRKSALHFSLSLSLRAIQFACQIIHIINRGANAKIHNQIKWNELISRDLFQLQSAIISSTISSNHMSSCDSTSPRKTYIRFDCV